MLLIIGLVFILFFFGIGSGFISSTPLGPINLLIADHYLSRPRLAVIPFIVGIILADVLIAFLAFWGYHVFVEETNVGPYVAIIGGIIVVILGVVGVIGAYKSKNNAAQSHEPLPKTAGKKSLDFIKGVVLCGFNPGLLLFWILMASTLESITDKLFGAGYEFDSLYYLLVLVGITIGEILWFILFIRLLKIGAQKFSNNILFYIRFSISALLVGLGFYLILIEGKVI
ncbi:MAG: LysE family transporter [Bacteroidetes bacterium]|nr:LysE family transporter [Bacteroidota bacterium]